MHRGIRLVLTVAVLTFHAAVAGAQQQSVFVVRHAERADSGAGAPMMNSDPDLSAAGKARAETLAATLKDARITAIFVTQFKRTRQTAEPLAKLLGIEPVVVAANDASVLTEKIKAAPGNVLVVGHSNTVGPTIAALGIAESVKVADDEFDNLFVVVRGEPPVLLRFHFR
jgi:broad specificity phosphatase PhoE